MRLPDSSPGAIYLFIYLSRASQLAAQARSIITPIRFIYLFYSPAPCPQVAARLISPAYPFIYLFIPQPSSIIACPSGILMHTYSFIYLFIGQLPSVKQARAVLAFLCFIYLFNLPHPCSQYRTAWYNLRPCRQLGRPAEPRRR